MLQLKTLSSKMNEMFTRISLNKPFDKNLKLYSKEDIVYLLTYLEDKEEYEKCQVISNYLQTRFNHSENYLK